MASLSQNKSTGGRYVQFRDIDGGRRTVRLGKCDKRTASATKTQIEFLVSAKHQGAAVPIQTAEWLATLDILLVKRLAAVGLVDPPADPTSERTEVTTSLQQLITAYVKRRTDVADSTRTKWQGSESHLLKFFGQDKDITTITAGCADDFVRKLRATETARGGKMAESTVARHTKYARQLFTDARKRRLLSENPFSETKVSDRPNAEREFFVSREITQKCIDAAPDWQWRLIIALARFGGLRCPSEVLLLRFGDVLIDQNRIVIHSPKTANSGKTSRVIPMFPELKPYLQEAWDNATDSQEFLVTRYRHRTQNLRTTFQKIIARAGLTTWPKLFQNLRASRQTELEESFPTHVVCKWMGNSPKVAQKHYLQTTEEHFEAACSALQNALQLPAVNPRNASQPITTAHEKSRGITENQRIHGSSINPTRT
ncbi:MAG: site-specific integrase [Fuerstiella sp.]